MATSPPSQLPLLDQFADARSADRQNRLLLEWLEDDDTRARLFAEINGTPQGSLVFPSRDTTYREGREDCGEDPPPTPRTRTLVELVTSRARIEAILKDDVTYSSRVYSALGDGTFMLALDPHAGQLHDLQKKAFRAAYAASAQPLRALAHAAGRTAAIMGFRQDAFDLAEFAEQAALRFCLLQAGYALKDYGVLEKTLRAAYPALVHQVFGRHFATDAMVLQTAKREMGTLLGRTAELIDAYFTNDVDELEGCDDPARPDGLSPALKLLAELDSDLSAEQRAVVAVGAAIGTVGNVQAAVCIVLKALFACETKMTAARELLEGRRGTGDQPDEPGEPADRPVSAHQTAKWVDLLGPLLRENPPIPFLPRVRLPLVDDDKVPQELLLALGGATAGRPGTTGDDPLVWGLATEGRHWCQGQALAWPLVIEIVRQVVALPGLAEGLKREDATVEGLEKVRGFACTAYPLTWRRHERRAQTSLNVAMRIKAPIPQNMLHLVEVIKAGAPRIEQLLRASNHVHFAWFEIIDSGTVLVLHTVYDGPFGAYLQHFALEAGDLFDVLFQYIEDPPPMPVSKYPIEFVTHLLRYNREPAGGYFFSAYPRTESARIVDDERRRLDAEERARRDWLDRRAGRPPRSTP